MNEMLPLSFPGQMVENPNPNRRSALKVYTHSIIPIELLPNRGSRFPESSVGEINGINHRNASWDPAFMPQVCSEGYANPLPYNHFTPYLNPSVHPSVLHYDGLPDDPQLFMQAPPPAPFMSCPSNESALSPPHYDLNQATLNPYPRRGEDLPPTQSNSRSLSSSMASPSTGESYFCRTPNSTLRQRTAQACEKCRDRKTKVCACSFELKCQHKLTPSS